MGIKRKIPKTKERRHGPPASKEPYGLIGGQPTEDEELRLEHRRLKGVALAVIKTRSPTVAGMADSWRQINILWHKKIGKFKKHAKF